jgi:hypothetical protein
MRAKSPETRTKNLSKWGPKTPPRGPRTPPKEPETPGSSDIEVIEMEDVDSPSPLKKPANTNSKVESLKKTLNPMIDILKKALELKVQKAPAEDEYIPEEFSPKKYTSLQPEKDETCHRQKLELKKTTFSVDDYRSKTVNLKDSNIYDSYHVVSHSSDNTMNNNGSKVTYQLSSKQPEESKVGKGSAENDDPYDPEDVLDYEEEEEESKSPERDTEVLNRKPSVCESEKSSSDVEVIQYDAPAAAKKESRLSLRERLQMQKSQEAARKDAKKKRSDFEPQSMLEKLEKECQDMLERADAAVNEYDKSISDIQEILIDSSPIIQTPQDSSPPLVAKQPDVSVKTKEKRQQNSPVKSRKTSSHFRSNRSPVKRAQSPPIRVRREAKNFEYDVEISPLKLNINATDKSRSRSSVSRSPSPPIYVPKEVSKCSPSPPIYVPTYSSSSKTRSDTDKARPRSPAKRSPSPPIYVPKQVTRGSPSPLSTRSPSPPIYIPSDSRSSDMEISPLKSAKHYIESKPNLSDKKPKSSYEARPTIPSQKGPQTPPSSPYIQASSDTSKSDIEVSPLKPNKPNDQGPKSGLKRSLSPSINTSPISSDRETSPAKSRRTSVGWKSPIQTSRSPSVSPSSSHNDSRGKSKLETLNNVASVHDDIQESLQDFDNFVQEDSEVLDLLKDDYDMFDDDEEEDNDCTDSRASGWR